MNKALIAEIGAYGIIALLLAFLFDMLDLESFLTFAGFLGFGSVQAIRELFLEKSRATRVVTAVGVLLCAVWGYGTMTDAPFADTEELGVLLAIVFGVQALALSRGIARSNGRTSL